MKASDGFESVINAHLEKFAAGDPLFAETFKKPNKNIKDCCTYIMNTVKASGKNGFADDEVFGMAVHYYDEDDIKPGNPISGKVIVNHSVGAGKKEVQVTPAATAAPIEKKKTKKVVEKEKDQIFLF